MRFPDVMPREVAKRLLDLRREGAPMSQRMVRAALRASGDLRSEWRRADQRGPARERSEHPRMDDQEQQP